MTINIAFNVLSSNAINALTGIKRGIEKESLRVTPQARLSQKPHPHALGSSLTHPFITTDFSESLIELITGTHQSVPALIAELHDIHQYTYACLEDELLWANSMPCFIEKEEDIAIADYGSSHTGQIKNIYRRGLGLRYGRMMQTISGIHFNLSFSENFWEAIKQDSSNNGDLQAFINKQYFGIIRNVQRFSWILSYFLGCSPFIPRALAHPSAASLQSFDQHTLFAPKATSLRLSDVGYNNHDHNQLHICYEQLETYLKTMRQALKTSHPPFEALGLRDGHGYKQLNNHFLQIENEYYSAIRPKRIGLKGERPIIALENYGVEYVEVRVIDLNAFSPIGITESQVRFLDMFLLACRQLESPFFTKDETQAINQNKQKVALDGLEPTQDLTIFGLTHSQKNWTKWFLIWIKNTAAYFDKAYTTTAYTETFHEYETMLLNPEALPVNQLKLAMKAFCTDTADTADSPDQFSAFTLEQSKKAAAYFAKHATSKLVYAQKDHAFYQQLAQQSHLKQQQLEKESKLSSFDSYLARYLET